jgi:hypothetical protein
MPRVAAIALPALLALAACSPSPTEAPSNPATGPASPVPASTSPVGSGEATAAATVGAPPSQTDTIWGRIWDGLPATFPLPPGAQPAEDPVEPVSAAFDVSAEGGGPADIARFYADVLAAAGYSASIDGPLEDGSFIVEARQAPACQVQTRSGTLGGLTRLTILYGAGCPFE